MTLKHIQNCYSRSCLFNLPVQLANKYLACVGGYALDGGMLRLYGGVGTNTGSDNTFQTLYLVSFTFLIFILRLNYLLVDHFVLTRFVYNIIDGVCGGAHL